MARTEELRLIAKVASLYYERKLRQSEIAAQLDLSQAGVSRLLKRAEEENIVKITVNEPLEAYTDLENELEQRYGLKEAIVVASGADESQLLRNLGNAAAFFLETTLKTDEVIGISSWSETLLAMTNAMHPVSRAANAQVVQILGGIGNPMAEVHAAQITRRLANLLSGKAIMLPAPGVVASKQARDILLADTFVSEAVTMFDRVTLAMVGIGSLAPSRLLASSGNSFSEAELESLKSKGAVGDVCLRFFDEAGKPIRDGFHERVVGISLEQLKGVARTVGIAGGSRKHEAIKAALKGKWIHILITDYLTAQYLIS